MLIDADSYLLELVRYIHLNPVRAGMVVHPHKYPWSGHRAYLGLEVLPWLTTDWVYSCFAPNREEALRHYNYFITGGLQEDYREEFHRGSFQGRALGDDVFIDKALAQAEEAFNRPPAIETVIQAVCSIYALTTAEMASRGRARPISEARAVAALLIRETDGLSLRDLGKALNQDLSSLSQAARRLEIRIQENPGLKEKLEAVKRNIPTCQA
ncbi:hypothetical protein DESUT3_30820 [Desulfuromonas versatilis]|uniref:Chromosomal replication initiator DnaA C-terminal domain-containing protein n=1 Tax=Desulfuromonas versatilis TaxID=2802975 RepID=A0ABM8HVM0_9BACT|nr:hypothetical protein DESUT3_30820 [Desulfuromonas versatilis]